MVRVRVGAWSRRRRLVRGPRLADLRGARRRHDPVGQQPAAVEDDAEPVAEIDAPEEVDLVFRLQRRLAFTAGVVFLAATLAVPVLSITWPTWYAVGERGGITPNFAAVAFLLPTGYAALALVFRRRADVYEERILGRREPHP